MKPLSVLMLLCTCMAAAFMAGLKSGNCCAELADTKRLLEHKSAQVEELRAAILRTDTNKEPKTTPSLP